jgi:hypothetical protein
MASARKISKERSPMGTWFYRIVKAGVIATFLGIMVLGIFVAIARSEIDKSVAGKLAGYRELGAAARGDESRFVF